MYIINIFIYNMYINIEYIDIYIWHDMANLPFGEKPLVP